MGKRRVFHVVVQFCEFVLLLRLVFFADFTSTVVDHLSILLLSSSDSMDLIWTLVYLISVSVDFFTSVIRRILSNKMALA